MRTRTIDFDVYVQDLTLRANGWRNREYVARHEGDPASAREHAVRAETIEWLLRDLTQPVMAEVKK